MSKKGGAPRPKGEMLPTPQLPPPPDVQEGRNPTAETRNAANPTAATTTRKADEERKYTATNPTATTTTRNAANGKKPTTTATSPTATTTPETGLKNESPPSLPIPQLPPPPETLLKIGNQPPLRAQKRRFQNLLRQFAATIVTVGMLFIRFFVLFQFEDGARVLLITSVILAIDMGRNLLARARMSRIGADGWNFMNSWVARLSTGILLLLVCLLLGSVLPEWMQKMTT